MRGHDLHFQRKGLHIQQRIIGYKKAFDGYHGIGVPDHFGQRIDGKEKIFLLTSFYVVHPPDIMRTVSAHMLVEQLF
jgi:hypothetical protein